MKKAILLLGLLAGSLTASAQWVNQPITYPTPAYFNLGICAVDANVAWTTLVNIDQEALTMQYARTTNGGTTWSIASVPGNPVTEFIVDLQALDANTAWAAIATDPDDLTGGRIVRTTDGGTTWTTVTTPAQFSINVPVYVRFFNPTQGVAIGESLQNRFELYTTTNGGTSWTAVPTANIPAKLANEHLLELLPLVAKVGNSLWMTTDRGRVFYTTNAGQSWAVSNTNINPSNEFIEAIAFRDASNGLILLDTGQLQRTTDGGVTWTRVVPTGAYHSIGMDVIPGTRTYVATGFTGSDSGTGTGAGSSYSTDDGQTWTTLESTFDHALVDFVSPTVGWSAGLLFDANGETSGGSGMNKYTGPALATARPKALALQVAPNPSADGRFRVRVPAGPAAQLRVRDALGRLVLEQPATAATETTLDLSRCRAGLYTLELRAGDALGQQKLIIQ